MRAEATESRRVARPPDYLTLKWHRDDDKIVERSIRWALVAVITVISIAGLFNVFGQHPTTTHASGDAADLTVFAPARLRGGLFYEGRITVAAHRQLNDAVIVLDHGWAEQ